jgi:hypothetical protein
MSDERDDPEELIATLHRMEADDLRAMTDAEVARAITEAGGDPVAIGERAEEQVARLLERRKRLAWQADAAARRDKALALIAKRPPGWRGTRAQMLDRIKNAPRDLGFRLAAAFRKGGPEAATDEELVAIVDEIALLEVLHADDDQR